MPIKIEFSEASKVFIQRERSQVDRHTGRLRERESHPCGILNHLYGAFLLVSFGQSSSFAWFWVHVWFISGFPRVCAHLLVRIDSSEEAYGLIDITCFLTSKEHFCECIVDWKGLLDVENKKEIHSLYFSSGQGSTFPLFLLFWSRGQTPDAQLRVPIYLLSQYYYISVCSLIKHNHLFKVL